jgi:hypothetical protein
MEYFFWNKIANYKHGSSRIFVSPYICYTHKSSEFITYTVQEKCEPGMSKLVACEQFTIGNNELHYNNIKFSLITLLR